MITLHEFRWPFAAVRASVYVVLRDIVLDRSELREPPSEGNEFSPDNLWY